MRRCFGVSKIRRFCLERPQGFSGLAPRPLLQLHSQQETCQPTCQRSGVGLTRKCRPASPPWSALAPPLADVFTDDNDPNGEHDFGSITHQGRQVF